MKFIKKVCIIALFVFSSIISAQNHTIGISWEPYFFVTEKNTDLVGSDIDESAKGIWGYESIYLSYKYNISNIFAFGIKTGYMDVSDENFTGYQAGGYLYYNPTRRIYLLAGFNYHFNKEETSRNRKALDTTIPFFVTGFGTRFSDESILSVGLLVHFPLKNKFAESVDVVNNISTRFEVSWMWKLSVGVEFDL